jgi:glycosyltransferase involved in cell wall biosynthesis
VRVLHLAPSARSADALTAHSFIDEEILALRETGLECHVLSDALTCRDTRHGVPVHGLPDEGTAVKMRRIAALANRTAGELPWGAARNAREFVHALRIEAAALDVIRRERIDVVHSHFGWPGGFGGALAAAAHHVPIVASLRGMDLLIRDDIGYGLRRDAGYRAALAGLLTQATRTIYATEFMRREGIAAGAPPERTVVVRKGVDLQRFRPAADRAAAARALGVEPPMILAVGGLGPRKGYADLLDALGWLTTLPWTLALCGDGSERDALETRARALGIGSRVRFCGWISRERIASYFAAADIFVHPALVEAAGNVILEAQAAGCAVVATDSGGPAEYVIEGETGKTVPPADPAALADALRVVLEDDARRARWGRQARRSMETRHDYARMIRDLTDVYTEAVGAESRQAAAIYKG